MTRASPSISGTPVDPIPSRQRGSIRTSGHWPWAAAAWLLVQPCAAQAQVLMRPAGEGRVITTGILSHSSKGFDDDADVRDIADYDQTQVYVAAEYGLTKDVTLLLTPSYRSVDVDGGDSTAGFGYTDVGARVRLAGDATTEFTAQGLVRVPGKRRGDNLAQIGETGTEYDLRLQGAKTFVVGGLQAFAILEGSYRLRAGEPPDEFHADATLGVRVAGPVLLLASSYNTISNGAGRGVFADRFRYHNLYVSGVYDVSTRVSLQLGVQGTLAGRNALRERGVLGGFWFRY